MIYSLIIKTFIPFKIVVGKQSGAQLNLIEDQSVFRAVKW